MGLVSRVHIGLEAGHLVLVQMEVSRIQRERNVHFSMGEEETQGPSEDGVLTSALLPVGSLWGPQDDFLGSGVDLWVGTWDRLF